MCAATSSSWRRKGVSASSPGKPRVLSADEQAQAAAEDAERAEVIRRAEEYRAQARRRALFLQENPPTHQWQEPPRYQLV